MSDNKRLKNYDDLPLVLDVADIRRIMGISRVSAYELFYPQLGVKTLLDGGRRRTKNLYGVVKRTVPAGQVRQ